MHVLVKLMKKAKDNPHKYFFLRRVTKMNELLGQPVMTSSWLIKMTWTQCSLCNTCWETETGMSSTIPQSYRDTMFSMQHLLGDGDRLCSLYNTCWVTPTCLFSLQYLWVTGTDMCSLQYLWVTGMGMFCE